MDDVTIEQLDKLGAKYGLNFAGGSSYYNFVGQLLIKMMQNINELENPQVEITAGLIDNDARLTHSEKLKFGGLDFTHIGSDEAQHIEGWVHYGETMEGCQLYAKIPKPKCEHDMVYQGHVRNYDIFECIKCGTTVEQ